MARKDAETRQDRAEDGAEGEGAEVAEGPSERGATAAGEQRGAGSGAGGTKVLGTCLPHALILWSSWP